MREIFESCYPHFAEDGVHEPIATWRQFAERAYYLVDAAAQMEKLTSAQKQWLFARVEHWLDLGGVRPLIRFENDKPRVSLGSGTLFGALGVQLMLVVTKTDGLAICSYCGDAYIPRKRRPKAGQRSYCECCRDAGRKADAQRDHKRRLKDAKVLLRRGKSPKEICRRIGGRVATYERLAREKKEQKTRRRSR